jgi:hypothetical protein
MVGMNQARDPKPVSIQSTHSAAAPEWAADMKVGYWYRVSGDHPDLGLPATPVGTRYLEDNDPARDARLNPPTTAREWIRRALGRQWLAPWSGRSGFSAITEAWNGAIYASGVGAAGAMIIFGGGHNVYFGSDTHAFDLATRTWRRLTDGFVTGGAGDYGEGAVYPNAIYPDGSPLPPHTYGYIQYDAATNRLLLAKGQTELGPHVKAVAIPHLLDLTTLTWQSGPRHPWAILNSGGFSTWDADRRLLWVHSGDSGGGNAFAAYSPDNMNVDGTVGCWSLSSRSKLPGAAEHNAMQIYPIADLIVVSIHSQDRLGAIDPKAPGEPIIPVVSRGAKPRIREFAALEYSARMESLIYYSAIDGAVVHAIEGDRDMNWRVVSAPDSLDPVADAAARSSHRIYREHTFGKFRVAQFATCDLAVLVRHVDTPVYCLRLPSR